MKKLNDQIDVKSIIQNKVLLGISYKKQCELLKMNEKTLNFHTRKFLKENGYSKDVDFANDQVSNLTDLLETFKNNLLKD